MFKRLLRLTRARDFIHVRAHGEESNARAELLARTIREVGARNSPRQPANAPAMAVRRFPEVVGLDASDADGAGSPLGMSEQVADGGLEREAQEHAHPRGDGAGLAC